MPGCRAAVRRPDAATKVPFSQKSARPTTNEYFCRILRGQKLRQSNVHARLAQPVERKALNLVVVGSSPTLGTKILPPSLHFAQNPPSASYTPMLHTPNPNQAEL